MRICDLAIQDIKYEAYFICRDLVGVHLNSMFDV